MKLQYLGDSKDSFKWDYHDYLATKLGFDLFNIVLMMTPDDHSGHGQSHPSEFPARPEIIEFCRRLRDNRSLQEIFQLPSRTGSPYKVALHRGSSHFSHRNRPSYFSGFDQARRQLVFLDPDNGFEPQKSCTDKHVKFSDLDSILQQISSDSLICCFSALQTDFLP